MINNIRTVIIMIDLMKQIYPPRVKRSKKSNHLVSMTKQGKSLDVMQAAKTEACNLFHQNNKTQLQLVQQEMKLQKGDPE